MTSLPEVSDLDRAAARRLTRSLSKVGLDVFSLYQVMVSSIATMLYSEIGSEKTWELLDAAITMIYADIANRVTNQPAIGGPHQLFERFKDAFKGYDQLAFHVCRSILFCLAGVCVPDEEAAVRAEFKDAFDDLVESLR